MATRRGPLNLAELVPELPEVVLPSKNVVQVVPFTAASYEKYRLLQKMTVAGMQQTASFDEDKYLDLLNEVLCLVIPSATPDDLASFGDRVELKLSVLAIAAGRVDEVVQALEAATGRSEGKDEAPLH